MTSAELVEDRDLALELHRLLSDIDPVRWRAEMAAAWKKGLADLQPKLERRHATLATTLKAELPATDTRSSWLQFKQRMQPAYMEFAKGLQLQSIHVPSLRPTNYRRSLLHVASGAFGVFAIEVLPWNALLAIAGAWAVFAWGCEISRRVSPRINTLLMKVFGPVAHEHESHRVNSATWYASALLLLALTHEPLWCVAGVAVLAIGDPVAGLIGRRFGRIRLMHGRSLEGTAAFFFSSLLVVLPLFVAFHGVSFGVALALAAAAGLAGAIAELVSLRIDDNFSIPLSAAAGVALMGLLVG
ncbi:MAG: diacylglycerol/polyprenol kinase family protein [Archangium sp.]